MRRKRSRRLLCRRFMRPLWHSRASGLIHGQENLVSFTGLFGGKSESESGDRAVPHIGACLEQSRSARFQGWSITNWHVRERPTPFSFPGVAVILANENLFPGRVIRETPMAISRRVNGNRHKLRQD